MLIILIILLILMFAGLPSWPWAANAGWGYYPSGLLGVILLVILLYMVIGGGVIHRL